MSTNWGERAIKEERSHQRRKKSPSFSSSLLDAICHSIDEPHDDKSQTLQDSRAPVSVGRKQTPVEVGEEIASLRRAIIVEKWMENYTKSSSSHRHFNSGSSSSADSSMFSSSETESGSRSTPSSSIFHTQRLHFSKPNNKVDVIEATPKNEGRLFMRTKSKALKLYGDLKKVKQPISPGSKSRITSFLNSFFPNSRSLKKDQGVQELRVSGLKSRSVKESATGSLNSSRSCLTKPAPSSANKSKRSVRFCPVSVILDEDSQPRGHKKMHNNDDNDDDHDANRRPMPKISSHNIKKNIESFRDYGGKHSCEYPHNLRGFYGHYYDDDGDSCTSSDLFELDNISILGINSNREELPVYGTTNLKMNQAIATRIIV